MLYAKIIETFLKIDYNLINGFLFFIKTLFIIYIDRLNYYIYVMFICIEKYCNTYVELFQFIESLYIINFSKTLYYIFSVKLRDNSELYTI